MKRDKLPSAALSRNFLALKRAFMPGYLLLRWSEIESITTDRKDKTRLCIYRKDTSPSSPVRSYFPLKPQDLEQVLLLAQEYIHPQVAMEIPAAQHPYKSQVASLPPPRQARSCVRPFFKWLVITACIILVLFIALILYTVIDNTSNLPSQKELQVYGHYAPYEEFMRTYSDSAADMEPVILNYTFIYNGWLIEQKCHSFSSRKARRLQHNVLDSRRLFRRYLSSRLRLSFNEALRHAEFLHNAIASHVEGYDCSQKADKITDYSYYHSRKWARATKALPYEPQQ